MNRRSLLAAEPTGLVAAAAVAMEAAAASPTMWRAGGDYMGAAEGVRRSLHRRLPPGSEVRLVDVRPALAEHPAIVAAVAFIVAVDNAVPWARPVMLVPMYHTVGRDTDIITGFELLDLGMCTRPWRDDDPSDAISCWRLLLDEAVEAIVARAAKEV